MDRKKVVLYIEDNLLNFRLVKRILHANNYVVIHAEDGQSGLRMARYEQPDVILQDINLPDIMGTDVVRTLKNDPTTEHIPVIALTANMMYGDREVYMDAGCDDYVAKPVTRLELLSAIERRTMLQATA